VIEHSHPLIGDLEVAAVEMVLRSGHLAQGAEVSHFEEEFARALGVDHAVAVANGTVAIEIGLQTLGIGPGDEVIVPSFTFIATANAVRRVGATPVFADIDPKTFCLSAATTEPHLTTRTRAVIAVHLYGHPADIEGLDMLTNQAGIHLIEDTAQGLGASWEGRNVGTFGEVGTFSLYATKNITTGEGGMITTSNPAVAETARALRAHQSTAVNGRLQVASNARMTDIAAAIGRVQLDRLDELQQGRQRIAARYDEGLMGSAITPHVASGCVHGYHQYTVRVGDRRQVIETLRSEGVGYGIYYSTPVHLTETYIDPAISLPDTEEASEEVLSLPIRPDLTELEQERVIEAVNKGGKK
jgi:perosamine synthetase